MTAQTERVLSGRYRLGALIGRGGMATVYRGEDLTLGRPVAIKLLSPDLARDSAFRSRFRMEAQAASRMSHPAIVRVFDAGEDSETDQYGVTRPIPYIVMELVEGRLLKDIASEGPLPVKDAVRYVDGILEALEYSHRAGVIHRDIKPGNVMVTPAGQVKVMDFGIARAVSDTSSTVAETTTIIGTAAYFSPEQAKGEAVDARADLYSTGIVLYELLTGKPPFRGETPVAVAYQHVSETPALPSESVDSLSRSVDAVVMRALAKDPAQRFPDAATFREELDGALDGRTSKRQVGIIAGDLYGPNTRGATQTSQTLRQLSTDTSMRRTQSGPPVVWIWTGFALVAAFLVAVFFWVMSLRPPDAGEAPSTSSSVPDIIDMPWTEAEPLVTAEELVPVVREESSSDIEAGNVIRTDPDVGVSMSPGQEVTVFVSTGAETATVPQLVDLTETAATDALEDAGLGLGSVRTQNHPSISAGTVLSASFDEGDVVDRGTRVDLVVASGVVTVGDVRGWTFDAAQRELTSERLGLQVARAEDPECAASNPEIVERQSRGPGEVDIGSEVTLTVCTGTTGDDVENPDDPENGGEGGEDDGGQ